jgi:serine/threonine protein kinase/tetratricopeptide (TPR) repeat protein
MTPGNREKQTEQNPALCGPLAADTTPLGADNRAAASPAPASISGQWGPLIIRELVGRGGFGEVYRAFDQQLDREVALKLLFHDEAQRAPDEGLEREGRLLARLRHPNIVSVYGCARHDGRVGLWMELIVGRTLDQIVAAQGRFGAYEAAAIVCNVCRAAAAVHASGLVHRDIKAQNVIREDGGRIVLTDFGLGCFLTGSDSGQRVLAGSPDYMAPELFSGGQASIRSDIYAIGVLLFYLVTAEFPIDGRSLAEYIEAHAARKRKLLVDIRADLPDNFVRIVERSLQPDPAQRFGSAGELLSCLAELQFGTTSFGAVSASAFEVQPPSRRKMLTYGAAVLGVSAVSVASWYGLRRLREPAVEANSIVVLPFENLTKQPSDDMLADSLTEGLIDTLTRSELRVIARTSAFGLRGTRETPREIGNRLGVETLLTGTVRRVNNHIRVSAQLVAANSGFQIWAETFEQQPTEALAVEEEIGARVASKLRARLLDTASSGAASAQRSGTWDSHNAYTQGRYHATRRTMPSLQLAVGYFESAIRLDPGYALAYAGLADALANMGVLRRPAPEQVSRMKQAATKALELDSSLAEPYTTLGMIALLYDWDAQRAETCFRRAFDCNSRFVEARRYYAGLLMNVRRFSEATSELEVALIIDPLSTLLRLSRAYVEYVAGSVSECAQRVNAVMELDPAVPNAWQIRGLLQIAEGRPSAGIEAFRRSVEVSGNGVSFRAFLGFILGICGEKGEARTILRDILAGVKSGVVDPLDAARVYAGLGEKAATLDCLNQAWKAHSPNLVQLLITPTWDLVRADPGFADLVRRVPLFQNVRWDPSSPVLRR